MPESVAFELFSCHVMTMFKQALAAHDCLAQAYYERTGLPLEQDTAYTLADMRRASRLLRAHYDPEGNDK